MGIDELKREVAPKFEVGDLVKLKSSNEHMVILDMAGLVTFQGYWIVNFMDRIKQYNNDGTAIDATQIVSKKVHQNVLEKLQEEETIS